jgi:hypothetical protein
MSKYSIQFILRANLTAQRPITKQALVENKKHTHKTKYKSKEILIIINPLKQINVKNEIDTFVNNADNNNSIPFNCLFVSLVYDTTRVLAILSLMELAVH